MRRHESRSTGLFLSLTAACTLCALVFQLPLLSGPRAALRGTLAPFESMATGLEGLAAAPAAVIGDISSLRAENSRLQADNAALRGQVARLQGAAAENADLRRSLGFERSFGHRMVAAQVIGRGPDVFSRTLTLDRGSADGLRTGMVVVTGAGLVGRLKEVGPHSASVQTVADPSTRVNSYTVKSSLEGTVSGGTGPLRMEIQARPGGVVAEVGEWTLTSGVGGLYPRGIPVGQVIRFERRDSAPIVVAELAWANDLASVGSVLVIADFVPGAGG